MAEVVQNHCLLCDRCDSKTEHAVLFRVDGDIEYRDAELYVGHQPATYSLCQCKRCEGIAVFLWSPLHKWPESDFGERIYPPEPGDWPGIPEIVRAAYQEAQKVKYHSVLGYMILARRVLEVIANERGVSDNNLAASLQRLAEQGEMPTVLIEGVSLIRKIGNDCAHSKIDPRELDCTHIELVEVFLPELIHHIYIAPRNLRFFKELLCDG